MDLSNGFSERTFRQFHSTYWASRPIGAELNHNLADHIESAHGIANHSRKTPTLLVRQRARQTPQSRHCLLQPQELRRISSVSSLVMLELHPVRAATLKYFLPN